MKDLFIDEQGNSIPNKPYYKCPHNKNIVCVGYKKNKCEKKKCETFEKLMKDIEKDIPYFKES